MANGMPLDSIASRRTLALGCVAFFAGCVGAFAAVCALFARVGMTSRGWADVVHALAHATWISISAGAALAAGAVRLANRWYHWRGAYTCPYCARPLRFGGKPPCVCWEDARHPLADLYARSLRRHRPPALRHFRRYSPTVLWTYAALAPAVLVAVAVVRHLRPRDASFFSEWVMVHVLCCVLIAIAVAMTASTLEMLERGRRFRLRLELISRMLVAWPAAAFVFAAARELLRFL
jgi:hypothetical protein